VSKVFDSLPEALDPDSKGRSSAGNGTQRKGSFLRQDIDRNKVDFGRHGFRETWISGDVDFDIDECGEEHNAYNHEDTSVWNMPANNANFD